MISQIKKQIPWGSLSLLFLWAGIIFRLKPYLENRSFWQDEDWVALDISQRSYHQIVFGEAVNPDWSLLPKGFAGLINL